MEDCRLLGLRGLPSACKRHNGIQLGAKGYELVDCDRLPPVYHVWHACISSHVMRIGPKSLRFGLKEHDKLGMHTHLLFAMFCLTSISHYFLWVML